MQPTINTATNVIKSPQNLHSFLRCVSIETFFVGGSRDPDIEYSLLLASKPNAYLLMPQRKISPAANISVIGEWSFPVWINCSSSKKLIVQNITMKCDKTTCTKGNRIGINNLFCTIILNSAENITAISKQQKHKKEMGKVRHFFASNNYHSLTAFFFFFCIISIQFLTLNEYFSRFGTILSTNPSMV